MELIDDKYRNQILALLAFCICTCVSAWVMLTLLIFIHFSLLIMMDLTGRNMQEVNCRR